MVAALLLGSLALAVGVAWGVLWPGHDCGVIGCSQRGNPWHGHR